MWMREVRKPTDDSGHRVSLIRNALDVDPKALAARLLAQGRQGNSAPPEKGVTLSAVGSRCLGLSQAPEQSVKREPYREPPLQILKPNATSVLMVLWRGQCIVADWCAPEKALAVRMCGRVVENPFGMATGCVLMAWNEELINESSAPGTLQVIRDRGYACTDNLNGSGIFAVAAPVLDPLGKVSMALGCSVPLFGLESEDRLRLQRAVLQHADTLRQALQPFGEAGKPGQMPMTPKLGE